MVHVAVYGSRGYLGRTLVQLLVDHPSVETVSPVSTTAAGRAYGDEVPSFGHAGELTFVGRDHEDVAGADVAFLATGSDEALAAVEELGDPPAPEIVVDLSRAHRASALDGGSWSYGVAELGSPLAPDPPAIANPGCYPTATLLALSPALTASLAGPGPLVVDGKSGVSGAGATPRADLHFPETNESLRAYGVEDHDHEAEIQAAVAHLEAKAPDAGRPVRFTPHLVPQNRGLLVTAYLPAAGDVSQAYVDSLYQKAYADSPFVEVVEEPDTAHVKGSNRAQVAAHVDEEADLLVARGAIDNLVKGGAGNAVQTMNEALGLEPTAGLPLSGVAP